MSMGGFTFVYSHKQAIATRLSSHIQRTALSLGLSQDDAQTHFDELFERYSDLVVEDQTDDLDKFFRDVLEKVPSATPSAYLLLPLALLTELRNVLVEEQSAAMPAEAIETYNDVMNDIDLAGHKMICRLIDLLQESRPLLS